MISRKSYIAISDASVKQIRDGFRHYASGFHKDDKVYNSHIQLKYFHTQKVCKEILYIGKALGMNNDQLNFAEAIAWLHDIGRFEQFHRYKTFADAESENHSEIAIRVIENLQILKDFNREKKEVVYRSILNHNIARIPDNEPEKIDFYSRLLRDADKLDIWRVAIEQNIFHTIKDEAQPDHYQVPKTILDSFRNNKILMLDQIRSFYDSLLFRISWIYDLNYPVTVEQMMKRNIVKLLLDKIPDFPEKDEISDIITKWAGNKTSIAIS
ncbi:MAG: HD domain-containing protein [Bacteroidales bacterium]|nr:HD domain-containing protein [Bacteroidales bacterium]